MILLLLSFLGLGALLCVLVALDDQAADTVEAARVRAFDER